MRDDYIKAIDAYEVEVEVSLIQYHQTRDMAHLEAACQANMEIVKLRANHDGED